MVGKSYLVAGLMSGTSADGIDVAIAAISGRPFASDDALSVRQVTAATVPWPATERKLIFELFAGRADPALICRANFTLGERFAESVPVTQTALVSSGRSTLIGTEASAA